MEATALPVMTIAEVAEYLRIPRATVYRLAQQGKIPGQKVGKHWRFKRSALDSFLTGELSTQAGGEKPSERER